MNQTSRIGKFSNIVIVTVAFLVFWVYLGSIINFHQHHLFGRNLMPQGILAKREDSAQAALSLQSFPVLLTDDFTQNSDLLQQPAELTIFSEYGTGHELSVKSGLPLYHSLRGPPAV